jgi:hypothetical protein
VAREDRRTGSAPAGEFYYQQLDALRTVRQEVRRELLAEGKKHQAGNALPDSFDRSDPVSRTAWHSADPASFPHQAAAVDYSGFGIETKAAPITVVSTGSSNE